MEMSISHIALKADISKLEFRINDLIKTVYVVGLLQVLAIVSSILLIVNYML